MCLPLHRPHFFHFPPALFSVVAEMMMQQRLRMQHPALASQVAELRAALEVERRQREAAEAQAAAVEARLAVLEARVPA